MNDPQEITVLKKKLKICKEAILKEREAKNLLERNLADIKKKRDLLQFELDEKV